MREVTAVATFPAPKRARAFHGYPFCPILAQSGKREWRVVFHRDSDWLFWTIGLLTFVESISQVKTEQFLDCRTECRFRGDSQVEVVPAYQTGAGNDTKGGC